MLTQPKPLRNLLIVAMRQFDVIEEQGQGVGGVEFFLQVGFYFQDDEIFVVGGDEAVDGDVVGFESNFYSFGGVVLSDEFQFIAIAFPEDGFEVFHFFGCAPAHDVVVAGHAHAHIAVG